MVSLAILPPWLSALIILGIPTLYAFLFPRLRRAGETDPKDEDKVRFGTNQVAWVYSLALSFVLVQSWGDYKRARAVVALESDALLNITLAARVMPKSVGAPLRAAAETYANSVVTREWPAMEAGRPAPLADYDLFMVSEVVVHLQPTGAHQASVFNLALNSVRDLRALRSERLLLAGSSVPALLWFALISGTVVMLTATLASFAGKHRLFGMVVALLLSLIVFIAIQLEFPFTGALKIGPGPIREALAPAQR